VAVSPAHVCELDDDASIGNSHCLIKWDGRDERDAVVTVTDTSSNGTFVRDQHPFMSSSFLMIGQINGEKIGRGNSRILRDGNEIAFGTPIPGPPEDDYRTHTSRLH
jgi:ser/thr/tyr protein kinase RAD53